MIHPARGSSAATIPRRFTGVLIAAAFFCAIAPTLGQLQFGDPIENLNVATAMEIRRGGPWLFPTLQGEPRLAKPPLTAWVTAACLRRATLAAIDHPDPSVRRLALEDLAFEARLPALLAMCLMLVVVYEMGRTVWEAEDGEQWGHTAGWVSAIVCGSTLLFLRQCRLATIDAQLALWVSLANLFLAKAVLQDRRWAGPLGTGAALGLAIMTKGPIALVQTAVPFGAFVLWRRLAIPSRVSRARQFLLPMALGVLTMLVVGLAWYVCAAIHFSGARSLWMAEATRIGVDGPPSGAPSYRYIASCYLFSPWLIWLAAGIALAVHRRMPGWNAVEASRLVWPMRLSLLLLALPLFLISFSRDRYERYMTPMIPAAAVLPACVLTMYLRGANPLANASTADGCSSLPHEPSAHPRSMKDVKYKHARACHPERSEGSLPRATEEILRCAQDDGLKPSVFHRCMSAHLILTGAGVVGFVIAGASGLVPSLRTISGSAWFTPLTAALLCTACIALVSASAIANRRWRGWPVLATAALALAGQAIYYNRLGNSASSRSTLRPVADLILDNYPDADLYAYRPGGQNIISVPANDLSIHLNRTVGLVTDMSRLPASNRPQVFAIYRTRGPKYAEMKPPKGWKLVAKPTAGGNEDRYVFVREVAR
jgi:hypothetical protein